MAWVGPKVKVALVVLALLVIMANRLNGQLKPNEELIDGEVVTYELRVCWDKDDCPDDPEPVEPTSSSRPWPWPWPGPS